MNGSDGGGEDDVAEPTTRLARRDKKKGIERGESPPQSTERNESQRTNEARWTRSLLGESSDL